MYILMLPYQQYPPSEGQAFLFLNQPKSNYFSLPKSKEAIPYKQNCFYYLAETKQLFYISSNQNFSNMDPPVSKNKKAKWLSLIVGLSQKDPMPFLEYGKNFVVGNYEIYNFFVKLDTIEIADLKSWLEKIKVILHDSKRQHTEFFFKIEGVSLVRNKLMGMRKKCRRNLSL